jgi:hypothetical protein
MDVQTKKYMLYAFTFLFILLISQEVYKFLTSPYPIGAAITFIITGTLGYGITYLVLTHDINKFEKWKKQTIEYTIEESAVISGLSLSSTRENGRNTVILSATYNNYEITFSGLNPEFQFKYKIGDDIKINVHPEDSQRFVLDDLK